MTQSEIPVVEANASLVAPEDQKALVAVVQQNHLHAETALSLQAAFAPLFKQARDVIEKSRGIVVTDAGQKMEIAMARACRLQLKAIRVAGEKSRKEIKEESLRRSKAIDGFGNILNDLIASEETRLEQQEKFAELQEANRKAALKGEREKILVGIQIDPNLYALDSMSEETFQQLIEGTRLARAAEAERKRKEEADRIDREAKEQAERERIRLENERLKQEAAMREFARIEAEKKAAIERELAAAQLKKLDDEKRAAEMKARQEAAEADAKAKAMVEDIERQMAEQKRIADQAAAHERARVAAQQRAADEKAKQERETIQEAANLERLRLQSLAEVERQKAEAARKAAEEIARKEREESVRKLAEMQKAAAEHAAREKAVREEIEARAKAAREAEEKRLAEEKEAARRAAMAPDKDRLLTYANAIRALDIPTFSTPEGKAIATTLAASRDRFVNWCDEKASAL